MLNITIAKEEDAETLKQIAIEAFTGDVTKKGAIPTGVDTVDWHYSKIQAGMYYKFEVDGKIVGGINLFEWIGDYYGISSIFIHPDYQNQGIGSKAIEFIEQEYDQAKKWTLEAPCLKEESHKFYERHGFNLLNKVQPEGHVDFYVLTYTKEMH
ncbi:GNAT family N-acetyltransferase [Haloplasma contractile]|uniref:Acetyltransferase GNAT family protein n=1 Tax=Haloplasma contractile SSD-17B TaxID=1033810 RepID=F7Q1W1_9MOLU|nr:GNAT family N-acetyltransferase [Haloplasma contractile]ERJ12228.1 Acetyltransferase GNAT family protein [Haloplasma contractile SSD-17B]